MSCLDTLRRGGAATACATVSQSPSRSLRWMGASPRVEPPFQKKDKGGHRQECDASERQNADSKQDNEESANHRAAHQTEISEGIEETVGKLRRFGCSSQDQRLTERNSRRVDEAPEDNEHNRKRIA